MQYNVAQLLKEPIGSSRSYQLGEAPGGAEGFADHLGGSVNLLKTHRGVLVNAQLVVESCLICSRCLSEYRLNLGLDIDEEFFPIVDVVTGNRIPAPEGLTEESMEGVLIDASHTLDLTEVVRQYVITNSPMKPLCRAECGGLCPDCGANLNQQECQCGKPPPDPRWGDLVGLLSPDQS